jgi:hypothetical protein
MKVWGAASAGALALSVICPWVSALGTSVALADKGDGPFLLGGGIALAVVIAVKNWRVARVSSMLLGLWALAEVVYFYVKLGEARDEAGGFGALVSPGFGLYLAALAGVSMIVWACIPRKMPELQPELEQDLYVPQQSEVAVVKSVRPQQTG